MHRPKPLYRKVNSRAHGSRHGEQGGDYRYERRRKGALDNDATRGSMHSGHRHGRDYTPLFRFLLSRVGQPWNATHAEACARLDSQVPIGWMVAVGDTPRQDRVRLDEATYYSGLYVDDTGTLQQVAPNLHARDMLPSCSCCTHTFNGVRFGEEAP